MKPHLILYHWELPQALAEQGGWTNREIVHWFGESVEIISKNLGDRIFSMAPIDEPSCVSWLSHALEHHARRKQDLKLAALSMHNVLLENGRTIEIFYVLKIRKIQVVCAIWNGATQRAKQTKILKLQKFMAPFSII